MSSDLEKIVIAQGKQIEALTKGMSKVVETLEKTPAFNAANYLSISERKGEDPLSSRGFSFMKMLGVITGAVQPTDAKIEIDVHNRLHQSYVKDLGNNGYESKGKGIYGVINGKFLAPLATGYMQDSIISRSFRKEMKQLVTAGCDGADPHEMGWQRAHLIKGYFGGSHQKALSWLNELNGGALVAPPEQGELIELLRNKEALVNAGARVVPLPAQGRLKYPRQTAASNTYWIGENQHIPETTIGTGEVTLQGKKLAVLIKAPNELLRFANPAAEALMRDDMTKSLALGLDLACLEGQGGDNMPEGLIYRQNINTVTSSIPSPTGGGNALAGVDIYRMIAAIEESNAEFEGWIMRPKTLYKYYQLRAAAVGQNDSQGLFLFNAVREPGEGVKPMLGGYPVTTSTQISQSQSQGNASNLTYILGGMWSDYLIGMFGAIEFAATTLGDTAFQNDQTWVRGILTADCAPRHESAFVYSPFYDTTL
jgi:HK97 family phage major capsid protein